MSQNFKLPELDSCNIGIIGAGYVGLPLAIEFADRKNCIKSNRKLNREVIAFDINEERIKQLRNGIDKTKEIGKNKIKALSNLSFEYDVKALAKIDVFIITVPTPIDVEKRPDLSAIEDASKKVGFAIKERFKTNKKTFPIVIYESTVYPSATEEICYPILKKFSGCELFPRSNNIGTFGLGYSPERINPGDAKHPLTSIVKVTSGHSKEVANWIDEFYSSIIKAGTHKASSIKVAEASKIMENTQRDLNIALVNELSIIFYKLGISTDDVIKAASTKWNFLPFKPGLVGGHCIGVDPYYLTYKAKLSGYYPDVILAGRKINDGMGFWIVEQLVIKMVNSSITVGGCEALILGFAFKENCSDIRNTKVFDVIMALKMYSMKYTIVDPYVNNVETINEYNLEVLNKIPKKKKFKVVILAVSHQLFREWSTKDWQTFLHPDSLIFDIKGIVPKELNPVRI